MIVLVPRLIWGVGLEMILCCRRSACRWLSQKTAGTLPVFSVGYFLRAVGLCCPFATWRACSRDHATSLVTAILSPQGQRCGTVFLNSFGNRTSSSDNSNDRWKRLCLVSWVAAPCVWMLRVLTRNLTYLLTYWPDYTINCPRCVC